MPNSPFAAFANATLTFQRAIAPPQIDALGNLSAVTEDFVVTAYLKTKKSQRQPFTPIDGGQDNVIELEGRCIEPATLPLDILPGARAAAVIGGVEGEFYIEATIPSAFGVDRALGGKISGRFITRTSWGEAL